MNIGFLLPSLYITKRLGNRIFAPKDVMHDLATGLIQKGHRLAVYSPYRIPSARHVAGNKDLELHKYISARDAERDAGIKSILCDVRNSYEYELEYISRAVTDSNHRGIDIMHVHLSPMAHYFEHFTDMPFVYTLHDPVFEDNTIETWKLKRFRHSHFIAISQKQSELYAQKIGIRTKSVIHHGINLKDFHFSQKPRGEYLSWIGRYIQVKGVEVALRAAVSLKKQIRIASSENYHETLYYKEKIKPYFSSRYVRELKFITKNKKSFFLGNSRALLFPIKWEESFGMVMIEAMACGTPIVAFANGSVLEIVKDGKTGFIINDSNRNKRGEWIIKKTGIEGIIEAVNRIYSMPEKEYLQMRHNCRAHVEQKFTIERMVNDYENVYSEIIKNNYTNKLAR